jgi:hypothetical protein
VEFVNERTAAGPEGTLEDTTKFEINSENIGLKSLENIPFATGALKETRGVIRVFLREGHAGIYSKQEGAHGKENILINNEQTSFCCKAPPIRPSHRSSPDNSVSSYNALVRRPDWGPNAIIIAIDHTVSPVLREGSPRAAAFFACLCISVYFFVFLCI